MSPAKSRQAPAAAGNDSEWETVKIGLGEEYPLAEGESLIGSFLGMTIQPSQSADGEMRDATVYQFAVEGHDPDEIWFLWGSAHLDAAFKGIEVGTRVMVTYHGKGSFTSKDGPRQIRRYTVKVARR